MRQLTQLSQPNSKPNTTVQVEDTTEYVVKTSVDDLEDEVEQLKKSLKL